MVVLRRMGVSAKARVKLELIPVAVLLALPVLLFWRIVFAGEVLYWGTPILQFFAWRQFAVTSYLAGQVPLWNPFLGNGTPFAANWQSAVFYPLNAIYLFLPVEKAMSYSVVLHIGMAGLFMYVFGRALRLSRFGSFVAAVSYAFSGFLISRASFLSMTNTAVWLPLILAATETILNRRLVSKRAVLPLVALGSLAVGLQLVAGHGQLSFYSLLLVGAYAIFRGWQLARSGEVVPDHSSRAAGWALSVLPVLAMLALGVGIGAVQILPTAELAFNSVRAGGAGYDFAMAYSLLPWQIVGLLAPDFFGNPGYGDYWGPGNYWEASGYIGVLPLLAAGLGLLARAKSPVLPRSFLLGTIVVSLVFALGYYLPVYPFIFKNVPGFGFFQAPARFLFLYTLAAAVLAGIGSDALLLRVGSTGLNRLGRIALLAGVGVFVAMVAFAFVLGQAEGVRPTFVTAMAKAGALLAVSGLLLLLGSWLPKNWWQLAIGVFVAADLMIFGVPLNPVAEPRVFDGAGLPTIDFLREREGIFRVYTPDGAFLKKFFATHSFRTFGSNDLAAIKQVRDTAMPDIAMSFGIEESYNYDPLQVGGARQFLQEVDSSGLDPRLLGLMNVRYVLSDTVPSSSGLKSVFQGANLVHENPQFLERAFVVEGGVVRVGSPQEALEAVRRPEFDPRREVVLGDAKPSGFADRAISRLGDLFPVGPSAPAEKIDKAGATVVEYTPGRVILSAVARAPGYLILSDTYYPGWKAWVNGQSAVIYQANAAFRAVPIPAGQSVVEFRYEPASFKLGLALTVLSLATAVAIAMGAAWRRSAI